MLDAEGPLGVLDAAAALRCKRFSASELLASTLQAIELNNGGAPCFDGAPSAVNAWVRLYPERAEEKAREADERLAREGSAAPLLCGVPIGLKDVFGVAGLPLTASSRVLADEVAARDCELWSRLAREGMVLVGHTHTHEFAAGGTTDQVGNPWDPSRSAGGSSGGSAAAIAAGMVAAATGTDTAGSLRIPAAMCGISSVKPTFGRLPMDGVIPLSRTLDHAGPMARTVADCAVVLAAMGAGPAATSPAATTPLGPLPLAPRDGAEPLKDVRIAVLPEPPGVLLDDDVAAGVEAAVAACLRLGATAARVDPPAFADLADFYAILGGDAGAYHERFADRTDLYRPFLREILVNARDSGSLSGYVEAQQRRADLVKAWERWMDRHGFDLLLQATVAASAPPRTLGYAARAPAADPWILLTFTWDMAGFPVVALPAGLGPHSGLPVGVSLIARRGEEAPLLQAAIDLQERELLPPRWRRHGPPDRHRPTGRLFNKLDDVQTV